jgi:phage FluMu gp28-like protein
VGYVMGIRGINFLENWVRRNVTDNKRHGDRFQAKALADRCKAEAAAKGITFDDLPHRARYE